MKRLAAAVAALLCAGVCSCAALLGLEDRELDGEATRSTGTGSDGTCDTPADCPLAGSSCFVRVCAGGLCGLSDAPPGTLVASQKEGDCKQVTCDETGSAVEVADPEDPFDDGRPCTEDLCEGTIPRHVPTPIGQGCGGGFVCNGLGKCVPCLDDNDCGLGVCDDFKCVPDACKNGGKDNAETDIDCGGFQCNPCADLAACLGASDCASGVCTGGICQKPACDDGVANGAESDLDCGGTCPACADGEKCNSPSDCASGVCGGAAPLACQPPSCSDGVHNGGEAAVDCGGGCPPGSCDDGEPCGAAGDCQSGVCTGSACQSPTCSDGVKNGVEEGIDCGGGCQAC